MGISRMVSFHREDWLSLSQSVATLVAVFGAFCVVFVQNSLERRREIAAERKSLLRERYRSAAYIEALLGASGAALDEVIRNVQMLGDNGAVDFKHVQLKPSSLSVSMNLIAGALNGALPTEVMRDALSGFHAVEVAVAIAQHTTERIGPRVAATLEQLVKERGKLAAAQKSVSESRKKWEHQLN
ncbi:hypothetical protein [Paraburkholderia sp. A3RO-2L]|uniref:hypothetical protein n=1 Tax=Paraburkholderia sp. A3RO-2L TaxID=3028376 RepID=UPI003DA91F01